MNDYQDRRYILIAIFLVVAVTYIFRLFYIQVIDDSYKLSANNLALKHITLYAPRGLIYDRNNELLVYNEAAYNLMVIPREVKDIDTNTFCKLINISREEFDNRMVKIRKYSTRKASILVENITGKEWARIVESLYQYTGFFGEERTMRKYSSSIAGHALGYLNEVSTSILDKLPYYQRGDKIGASGIEKQYEEELRGTRGVAIKMRDNHMRIKGSYKEGKYDTLPKAGFELKLTLDAKLQTYGEQLMQNKTGSIVAIEPSTGEILALVTSPDYDPNKLVGRGRSKYFNSISNNDSLSPWFNRALEAQYPPGSIFKMLQALIGLEEGVISINTGFPCDKKPMNCHNHPPPSNLQKAIQYSCNPYFHDAMKRIVQQGESSSIFTDSPLGLAKWHKHVLSFGLGQRLDIDCPLMKSGNIPGVDYYNKIYGERRWAYSTIYSISIGQGEVMVVPLQMANLAAIFANRGYYYTPHLIKSIGENDSIPAKYLVKNETSVSSKHFDIVIEAMQQVVEADHGTARRARIDSVEVCGKTGTVQNPHGEDHSVFMAFAPKVNPQIAIIVYVENSGFGGTWAAPIASLMMEQYIKGGITDTLKQERILATDFIHGLQY
ncbi:MAG: penicillin-binding protein 2 [Flavobacteriales bacterium]|nr:penicillin-binding protein 2 [Flavobacteriales bacterium]